ncbi:MAG: cell division protein FtsZ [Verrucomicrobiota bacterium]
MIEFDKETQSGSLDFSEFGVKVLGVGGAGSNVLDRMALEGSDDAELLALNTDVRALTTSVSSNKVQLGATLLKGMGTGGDPSLGRQAALEAVDEIRESVRGNNMVFVCVGLGGGTGSGAAPEVCRIAREEGVFLVVFATLPFTFEGERRMEQAHDALDVIARYANAVITFENDRMGELIVPKDGVAQAFAAADKVISQSIRATMNVVFRPGIIRIGMDDLLATLQTKQSRCLFGYGNAKGENRAQDAVSQALKCPLLDKGKLLSEAQSILVHVAGGEDTTLLEVQAVMEAIGEHVGPETQILFGTGADKRLGSNLAVTIFSSVGGTREAAGAEDSASDETPSLDDPVVSLGMAGLGVPDPAEPVAVTETPVKAPDPEPEPEPVQAQPEVETPEPEPEPVAEEPKPEPPSEAPAYNPEPVPDLSALKAPVNAPPKLEPEEDVNPIAAAMDPVPSKKPESQPDSIEAPITDSSQKIRLSRAVAEPSTGKIKPRPSTKVTAVKAEADTPEADPEQARAQQEMLSLEPVGGGQGRFAKTDPTIVDGEDLDIPSFLRKKK